MKSITWMLLMASVVVAGDLELEGERLFNTETFAGNGRTCATCHRPEDGLRLTVETIRTLPASDPLFVSELPSWVQASRGLNLPAFQPWFPDRPSFEWPAAMRQIGAIAVDNRGDQVFRGVPALSNLLFTAPYGLDGREPSLKQFTIGAVAQHLTKSIERRPGIDYRLPTDSELDALVAYMESLTSHDNLDSEAIFRLYPPFIAEFARRGRQLFTSKGCTQCHNGPTLSGGGHSTGVSLLTRGLPIDRGSGTYERPVFDTPQLYGNFGALTPLGFSQRVQYGHNNITSGLSAAIFHYNRGVFKSQTDVEIPSLNDSEIHDISYYLALVGISRFDVGE